MGSAGEGMKCEGGFFATVSSGDAVKNSEQISRWGVAAGWLLLNCRSQVGNRGPTIKGDKGGCKGKRGRVYRQIERKSSGVRVKLGGRRRCGGRESEKRWKKLGRGKGRRAKTREIPFLRCNRRSVFFATPWTFSFVSIRRMQALRGILFDFFSFFLVGVLKLLVGYLKTNIIVQYCIILILFLRFLGGKRKYLERVSMLLEYILNIFISDFYLWFNGGYHR